MRCSSINQSSLKDNGFRFDASYHLSEGVSVSRAISSSPYRMLSVSDVSLDIFYGNRAKRVYVNNPKYGIPFMSSSDILSANLDNIKLASKKYTPYIDQLRLKEGWILISRSGTIGNTSWSSKMHAKMLATEDVIRVVPNDIMKGGCLYAYLSSKYGHSLLTQGTFGAVIQHIEPGFVAGIPIPSFPNDLQEKVDNLIKESTRLREEAYDSEQSAISIIESKIATLDDTSPVFSKSLKTIGFSWAAYNNNLYVDKINNKFKTNFFTLGSRSSAIFAPPLFKHIYLSKDNGYPFMTGSELTRYNLRYYRWLSPKGVKDINDYVVSEGTLLLYKSGTTDGGILGNVFIADKLLDGCCLSDHVIRIKMDDKKLSYWTYAFLRTNEGVHLLQSLATGTMIPFITPERLSMLHIITPDEDYDRVTSLIENYIVLKSKSKELENSAISLIEDQIEKWK